jgi:hypothetical protein
MPPAQMPPPVQPPPGTGMPEPEPPTETTIGRGGMAFDLDANAHDRVSVDADGALTIDREGGAEQTASYIWIADTGATPGTISKIDTRDQVEVARYAVGAVDPSRTSLSMNGDAYVASRAGKGVTKISTLGADCPDTNGDGTITTSSGPGDVLPWGEDDCVLWFQTFDQEIRGIAAQDIPARTEIMQRVDEPPLITTTPEQHYVWVGASTVSNSFDPMTGQPLPAAPAMAYKLDGDTGEILLRTEMPRGAYGFALDGRGLLWLTGGAYWNGGLAFIDTNRCVDDASCDVEPCRVTCSTSACPDSCDDAIKADITLDPGDSYGITVDCEQRVWLGGMIKRYDPLAPANERLALANPDPQSAMVLSAAGIAADANGWVWGAGQSIVRLDADTLTQATQVTIPDYAHGVAVDVDGKVWAITMAQSAHVIEPGAALTDNAVTGNAVTGLESPYTYSDMTGVQQLLAASNEPGTYQQVFEGCEKPATTTWQDFGWQVETPGATRVVFHVRAAETLPELEQASFHAFAGSPSNVDQASLGSALLMTDAPTGKYVEIKVELYGEAGTSNRCGGSEALTPRVLAFDLAHACPADGPGAPT